MTFDPLWAEDGVATAPTEAEQLAGFQCGPANIEHFNWIVQSLQAAVNEVSEVNATPTSRQINTTDGIRGGGDLTQNRTLRLDIEGLEEETAIANDDLIVVHDVSIGSPRKMTRANFVAGLGGDGTAGSGFIFAGENIGTGTGELYSGVDGGTLEFRSLLNGGGLEISVVADDVVLALADMNAQLTVE